MKVAACWSITAARFLRLTSAVMSSRSTAAVESRSSHSAIGKSVNRARLRAKARVDWARGPSLPSMLIGRPGTEPVALRSAGSADAGAGRVGREGLARDCLDAGGKPPIGIAGRNADGLGAEIETDQRAARTKQRRDVSKRQDGRGHG